MTQATTTHTNTPRRAHPAAVRAVLRSRIDTNGNFTKANCPKSRMAQYMVYQSSYDGLNLGIQMEQKSYVIVLNKSGSKAEASDNVGKLCKAFPTASVVQSNHDSLVIENEMPSVKSDALLKALGLQSKTGIKPYLLQVK